MTPNWQWYRLSGMPGLLIEQVFQIRQDVFLLEQSCLYRDIDGLDADAHHLVGQDCNKDIVAYCRVIEPGHLYREPAIGRVLVVERMRGRGIARDLMREAHRYCLARFPASAIRLNAQEHLQEFYDSLGYHPVGPSKNEDGIMHVEMLKPR